MLSETDLRTLRAVAGALIPSGGAFPLGAGDVGTAERIATHLERVSPATRTQIRALLRTWDLLPPGVTTARSLQPPRAG